MFTLVNEYGLDEKSRRSMCYKDKYDNLIVGCENSTLFDTYDLGMSIRRGKSIFLPSFPSFKMFLILVDPITRHKEYSLPIFIFTVSLSFYGATSTLKISNLYYF